MDDSMKYEDPTVRQFVGIGSLKDNYKIEVLRLSQRAEYNLKRRGINTLFDLCRAKKKAVTLIGNIGPKTAGEIFDKLKNFYEICITDGGRIVTPFPDEWEVYCAEYSEQNRRKKKELTALSFVGPVSNRHLLEDAPIEALGLSNRVYNCLILGQIHTINELCKKNWDELSSIQGFGIASASEIDERLDDYFINTEAAIITEKPKDEKAVDDACQGSNGTGIVCKEIRSFNEYVRQIPKERTRFVILGRMYGLTLSELGEIIDASRERVRQIEKAFWKTVKSLDEVFLEDRYVHLYEHYIIDERMFKEIFRESSATWYMVCNRSNRNKKAKARDFDANCLQDEGELLKDIESAAYDESLCDEVRQAVYQFIKDEEEASYVQIGADKVPARREDIENYVLRKYCRDEMFIEDFFERYNEILVNAGCDREELMATESVRRTRENRISTKPNVLWSFGRRMRYYDVDAYDFVEFFRQLKLDQFVDIEISTRKLMLEFPDLMEKYDIRNEYELHNLMKKQGADGLFGDLVFGKMPMLQFGNVDRTRYITNLLFSLAPISKDDFFEAVSQETGIQPEIVGTKQEFMSAIDVYLHDGMLTINSDPMPDNEMEVMLKSLTEDCYTINEIRTLYLKVTGNNDCELVSPYNLKRMGFKVYSGYILRNAPSAETYFTRLLTATEIVDYSDYAVRFKDIREWWCTLGKLKDEFVILEFLPQQVISFSRLQKYGVTKEGLMAFCDSVYAFTDPGQYFTVESLRKDGFDSKLFELGFDDWLYASILREDRRFGFRRMGVEKPTIVFCRDIPKVTRQRFLAYILDGESEDIDVLLDEIQRTYGVSIDRYDMNQILADSDMYYDSTMEKVYANKELYYEEV